MLDTDEAHFLYVIRYMQFHNIWTVYFDFLSGHYKPSVTLRGDDSAPTVDASLPAEMGPTLMFLLYSFFYSLVEADSQTIDAFRIWHIRHPEEKDAIEALHAIVNPIIPDLRVFRNKVGFHGSRTRSNQERGFEIFGNHSGQLIIEVMKQFKALNAALLSKEIAIENGSLDEEATARKRIHEIAEDCRKIKV